MMQQLSAEARNLNWLVSNFVERVPYVAHAIVVSADGLVMTSAHVVTTAGTAALGHAKKARTVYVEFSDGDRVQAHIVGYDLYDDVAILRVRPSQHALVPVPLVPVPAPELPSEAPEAWPPPFVPLMFLPVPKRAFSWAMQASLSDAATLAHALTASLSRLAGTRLSSVAVAPLIGAVEAPLGVEVCALAAIAVPSTAAIIACFKSMFIEITPSRRLTNARTA